MLVTHRREGIVHECLLWHRSSALSQMSSKGIFQVKAFATVLKRSLAALKIYEAFYLPCAVLCGLHLFHVGCMCVSTQYTAAQPEGIQNTYWHRSA